MALGRLPGAVDIRIYIFVAKLAFGIVLYEECLEIAHSGVLLPKMSGLHGE